MNSGGRNSGDRNSGNRNSGSWNSGDNNSGYCNSSTPDTINVFNKPCNKDKWNSADKPKWMYVNLTRWVEGTSMTDKEKEEYPSYTTTGGYLKVHTSLHHAYVDAWQEADEEDKAKTFKLPNFDVEVFKEVFGFDPREGKKETCEGKTVVIDGVTYKLEKCDDQ
jgi:hypothetical protein